MIVKGPVLITGAAGFIGSHLIDLFRQSFPSVPLYTTARHSKTRGVIPCNLTDASAVRRLLAKVRPGTILHTAGRVRGTAEELMRDNLLATSTLMSTAVDLRLTARLVVLGSAAEYGDPVDPYTWAKRCQTLLARQKAADGQDVVIVRLFNLTGPRLPAHFLAGNIARQIAERERGKNGRVQVGDLGAKRDFLDVRDAARGIIMAATHGKSGEVYEICTGKARPVRDVLDRMLKSAARPLHVQMSSSKHPHPIPISRGNPKTARRLPWAPLISFEDSLRDTLFYYRSLYA